jgi:hypothetical protein
VTDTGSLLFQTGFSGRAEMGLAGNDDFSVKVSADGAIFTTALEANAATGAVTLPQPVRLGGQATDPASPANGTLWLNTTTGEIKARTAGATIAIGAGGGGGGISDGDKGDVTVSAGGAVWTVDAGAITLSKMAGLANGALLGRASAGTGVPEALSASQVRGLLNVADGATANGTDAFLLSRANHTGTQGIATVSGLQGALDGKQPLATVLTNTTAAFTTAQESKLAGVAAGATANATDADLRDRATHTGTQLAATISDLAAAVAATPAVAANTAKVTNATHTGDVTGATALTIANDAVSNAKLANMAANTVKGAVSAGDPVDLTPAQVRTMINVADGATANATDAALRDRATHTGAQAIATVTGLQTALDGKLAVGGEAATVATINGRVSAGTNVTLSGAGTAASPFVINAAGGGAGTNLDYTAATRVISSDTGTDATLPLVTAADAGLAPASGGGTTNFLRADGTWAAPAGGGAAPMGPGDWWQSNRITTSIATIGLFSGAAISSGTNSAAIPSQAGLGHNPFGAFLRSSTTANSGYRYNTPNQTTLYFGGGVGFKFRGKFLWRNFTNNTVRIGFQDTSTATDAQDGAYFDIAGSTIAAKTATANARTQAPSTYTAVLDAVYTFDVDVNAAGTEARFRVYENLLSTPVLDQTITTNIPTTLARATGAGIVATNSGTVASDIGVLFELGIGTVAGFDKLYL